MEADVGRGRVGRWVRRLIQGVYGAVLRFVIVRPIEQPVSAATLAEPVDNPVAGDALQLGGDVPDRFGEAMSRYELQEGVLDDVLHFAEIRDLAADEGAQPGGLGDHGRSQPIVGLGRLLGDGEKRGHTDIDASVAKIFGINWRVQGVGRRWDDCSLLSPCATEASRQVGSRYRLRRPVSKGYELAVLPECTRCAKSVGTAALRSLAHH